MQHEPAPEKGPQDSKPQEALPQKPPEPELEIPEPPLSDGELGGVGQQPQKGPPEYAQAVAAAQGFLLAGVSNPQPATPGEYDAVVYNGKGLNLDGRQVG